MNQPMNHLMNFIVMPPTLRRRSRSRRANTGRAKPKIVRITNTTKKNPPGLVALKIAEFCENSANQLLLADSTENLTDEDHQQLPSGVDRHVYVPNSFLSVFRNLNSSGGFREQFKSDDWHLSPLTAIEVYELLRAASLLSAEKQQQPVSPALQQCNICSLIVYGEEALSTHMQSHQRVENKREICIDEEAAWIIGHESSETDIRELLDGASPNIQPSDSPPDDWVHCPMPPETILFGCPICSGHIENGPNAVIVSLKNNNIVTVIQESSLNLRDCQRWFDASKVNRTGSLNDNQEVSRAMMPQDVVLVHKNCLSLPLTFLSLT